VKLLIENPFIHIYDIYVKNEMIKTQNNNNNNNNIYNLYNIYII